MAVIVALAVLMGGCSTVKGWFGKKKPEEPPDIMAEEGIKVLKKKKYAEAIDTFEKLRDRTILIVPVAVYSQDTSASQKFDELKRSLTTAKSSLNRSLVDTSLLERRLSEVSEDIKTLSDQLKELDEDRDQTQNRIIVLGKEIAKNTEKSDEMGVLIEDLEDEIENQEKSLMSLLRIIYVESIEAGFFDSTDLQTVKLLLNKESANQILERADSLNILGVSLTELVKDLTGD